MNKRGISTVIATILIVLLGLVAVGIIWGVIQNILSDTEDDITIRGSKVNLNIKDAQYSDGKIQVRVERGIGEGEVIGLKFTISDGSNTEVIDLPNIDIPNINLDELETKTYTLDYYGIVKEITVNPVIKSSSGKTGLGGLYGSKEFSDEEVTENLGAISWWRFEENVRDELGNNHGTNNGADCTFEGKFGSACEFDGIDDYVNLSIGTFTYGSLNRTMCAWAKTNSLSSGFSWIVAYGNPSASDAYFIGRNGATLYGGGFADDITHASYWTVGDWNHICLTYDGVNASLYSNGVSLISSLKTWTTIENVAYIGRQVNNLEYWNGTIDEIMIFDRALTLAEVEDLHNYKF